MFALFHKTGNMMKEAKKGIHGKSIIGIIFSTCIIMFLSEAMLIIAVDFLGYALGFHDPSKTLLLGNNNTSQIVSLFLTISTILGVLIATKFYFKRSLRSLGLTWKHMISQYGLGLFIGFIMMSGAILLAYITGSLDFQGFHQVSFIILGAYFIGFMIQGFSEELMTRGFLMNGCAARKGTCYAILLNSIFFAVLHLANDGITFLAFVNLILAGISFSLMAVYFDNIIVCSAAHSMWNFTQGNLFGILVSGIYMPESAIGFSNVSHKTLWNGGMFGLEGGLAVTIIEIMAILVLCLLYQKKTQNNEEHMHKKVTNEGNMVDFHG